MWVLGYTFDEGAGTTFAPAYGVGTGVCSTVGKFVPGTQGTALGTAGGGTAMVTGSPILPMSTWRALTVMADITLDAGSGERSPLSFLSGPQSDFFGFNRSSSGYFETWLTGDTETTTQMLTSGVRYELGLTWDGATVRVYMGDALVDSYVFSGSLPNLTYIDITRAWWGGANGGTVDNLRIADHAAQADEIARLAGTPPSLSDNDTPGSTPLDTPLVTRDSFVNPSRVDASDGEVTISWSPVTNAVSYDAMIADSETPSQNDFVVHQTNVVSPYTFENLSVGKRAYGVIARAS